MSWLNDATPTPPMCSYCGRDLEDLVELETGVCTSDDCPSRCKCITGPEWSGSPNPKNPDNEWVCDDCGRVIRAEGGSK